MPERRVHLTIIPPDGGRIEIVRYEPAGKWFYEDRGRRKRLTLADAAAFGASDRPAVIWHEGRVGGRAFDARVRRLRASKAANPKETP